MLKRETSDSVAAKKTKQKCLTSALNQTIITLYALNPCTVSLFEMKERKLKRRWKRMIRCHDPKEQPKKCKPVSLMLYDYSTRRTSSCRPDNVF